MLRFKSFSALAIALAVSPLSSIEAAEAKPKPNVVLIMADDLGFETLSAYGVSDFNTPNLDALAEDGTVFEYCYATPICTATRVSLMTGKYNHRNFERFGKFPDKDLGNTFGNLMKEAGYATCIAGKWQLGPASRVEKMGFDQTMQNDGWGGYYSDDPITVNGEQIGNPDHRYRPDITNEFVLDFIEENKDGPFFLYYPMFLVHAPEEPSPDYPNKALIEASRTSVGTPKVDEYVFGDMMTYMDKLIGNVVRKVDEAGIRENTLILFLGDNGTTPGHAGMQGELMVTMNGEPYRSGGKGSMQERGTRVPLITNWKGVTTGTRCSDLTDITDFYPTLAAVADVSIPPEDGIDGVSFLPQIEGKEGTPRDWVFCLYDLNDAVVWRGPGKSKTGSLPPAHKMQGTYWARSKEWKLYDNGELYDMTSDTEEQNPILPEADTEQSSAGRAKLDGVFETLGAKDYHMITFQEYREEVQRKLKKKTQK